MILPDGKGRLLEPPEVYTAAEFSADATARFPGLLGEVGSASVHEQMHALAKAIRSAIGAGDLKQVRNILDFVAEAVERPEAVTEIANAVQISFLTPDDFVGQRGEAAWALVPLTLVPLIREAV